MSAKIAREHDLAAEPDSTVSYSLTSSHQPLVDFAGDSNAHANIMRHAELIVEAATRNAASYCPSAALVRVV